MSSKKSKKEETKVAESDKKKLRSKKKDKTKEGVESKETPAPAAPVENILFQPTETEINDPDAVQLFRRYDRERANHVTRSDFLELLREYNTWYPGRKWDMPVMPCALTDAAGIPLGFERTARNSEFEAGQLFERYDSDRSGTLEIKEFQKFYSDFKKQLSPFVEEMLSPRYYPHHSKRFDPYNSFEPSPPWNNPDQRIFDSRRMYESKLEQLQTIYDTRLTSRRAYLVEKLENLRQTSPWTKNATPNYHYPSPTHPQQLEHQIQHDIDAIDRIGSEIRTKMYLGSRASMDDIHRFLEEYPQMVGKIEELEKKVDPVTKSVQSNDDEREKLLKIKDQMIWGLIQDRNELRRQRDGIEAQLREMTELSAQEMRKWAKLTDDMQAEIERLRRSNVIQKN